MKIATIESINANNLKMNIQQIALLESIVVYYLSVIFFIYRVEIIQVIIKNLFKNLKIKIFHNLYVALLIFTIVFCSKLCHNKDTNHFSNLISLLILNFINLFLKFLVIPFLSVKVAFKKFYPLNTA